jgi:hypothetical protein
LDDVLGNQRLFLEFNRAGEHTRLCCWRHWGRGSLRTLRYLPSSFISVLFRQKRVDQNARRIEAGARKSRPPSSLTVNLHGSHLSQHHLFGHPAARNRVFPGDAGHQVCRPATRANHTGAFDAALVEHRNWAAIAPDRSNHVSNPDAAQTVASSLAKSRVAACSVNIRSATRLQFRSGLPNLHRTRGPEAGRRVKQNRALPLSCSPPA